jgi:hypothetical protein
MHDLGRKLSFFQHCSRVPTSIWIAKLSAALQKQIQVVRKQDIELQFCKPKSCYPLQMHTKEKSWWRSSSDQCKDRERMMLCLLTFAWPKHLFTLRVTAAFYWNWEFSEHSSWTIMSNKPFTLTRSPWRIEPVDDWLEALFPPFDLSSAQAWR